MATSTPIDLSAVAGTAAGWASRRRAAERAPVRADLTDEALIARTAEGDAAAFEVLMRRYQAPVFHFVRWQRGVTERSAEDITQEVFLQLYRVAGQFRGGARFRTWFYTLARNVCRNHQRALRRRAPERWYALPEEALAGLPDRGPGPQARCEHGEAQRVVGAAMSRLPVWQREVLVLREWQDLSYAEIADVLAVTIGTVRSRLHKARETLMALLGPAAGGAMEARA
jgi:RNA polymerase sigma-70 factor (ECF subfamily)